MRFNKGRFMLAIACVAWAAMAVGGLGVLWSYANEPGPATTPPSRWPSLSLIRPANDRATLVMSAHPHCPCTRASLGELARLMAQTKGRVTAYVLFVKPAGSSTDWEKTDLWRSAASIPDVKVLVDDEGAESHRFNSLTSGQTALYDVDGNLMFSGGITASRGHSGDNAGRSAIVSLLNDGKAERTVTSVFGCPLYGDHSRCLEEAHDGSKQ